jgi:hypothetical protein
VDRFLISHKTVRRKQRSTSSHEGTRSGIFATDEGNLLFLKASHHRYTFLLPILSVLGLLFIFHAEAREGAKQLLFQNAIRNVGETAQPLFFLRPSSLSTTPITQTPGGISFNPGAYSANEGAGSVAVTVVRTSNSSGTATVNYATSGGTATAGQDYTATTGTLIFAAGETSRTINVPLINDDLFEAGNETFNIALSDLTTISLMSAAMFL